MKTEKSWSNESGGTGVSQRRQLTALANFVRASRDEVTRLWVTAVDRSPRVKSSEALTFNQLLDHLPQLCDDLAAALESGVRGGAGEQADKDSSRHGRNRWQQGYQVEELVRELSIVRREFVGRWLKAFEAEVEPFQSGVRRKAKEIIHQFFDEVIAASVAQFSRENQRRLRESNAALRAAKHEAEEANLAKNHFIALVSHELRTPLTPILLMASSLRGDPSLPPQGREFVDLVCENVQLEAALIEDLLDASRLARDYLALELGRVDLHACLGAALKLSDLSFQSKQLTLVTQLDATSFHVRGDERRLKRALATLARNAMTVTPPNGKVTVTTASRGREIEIAFEDDGPPLDGEALRKLFLPFEEGRRASQFGLSELGLSRYICKAIIEAHGGEVKATARSSRRGGIICVKLKTLAK